jgi:hypothetical protein
MQPVVPPQHVDDLSPSDLLEAHRSRLFEGSRRRFLGAGNFRLERVGSAILFREQGTSAPQPLALLVLLKRPLVGAPGSRPDRRRVGAPRQSGIRGRGSTGPGGASESRSRRRAQHPPAIPRRLEHCGRFAVGSVGEEVAAAPLPTCRHDDRDSSRTGAASAFTIIKAAGRVGP